MNTTYISHYGSDLDVVNDARVSFGRRSDELNDADEGLINTLARGMGRAEWQGLLAEVVVCQDGEHAERLVRRIMRIQRHFAPFTGVGAKLHFRAPLFVARQVWKTTIGMNIHWSEGSGRYMTDSREFYMPDEFRAAAADIKQGSHPTETVEHIGSAHPSEIFRIAYDEAEAAYNLSLAAGIAPEVARMVLPQATMVEWRATGSLLAWRRLCWLRQDDHAQAETRALADQIEALVQPLFPYSWKALS